MKGGEKMGLEKVVESDKVRTLPNREYFPTERGVVTSERSYTLFSEQYLEKPVIAGDDALAISPTACTIKAIPVIDDW